MNEKKIENYIIDELPSNDKSIALDFINFLRDNELNFVKDNGYWKDKIYYLIKYNGECVCFIAIKDPEEKANRWTVWSADMDSEWLLENQIKEELKTVAFSHVDTCGNCGSCGGGKRKIIFGREFPKVCGCTFRIDNPDEKDLLFMKRIVEIRLDEIDSLSEVSENE